MMKWNSFFRGEHYQKYREALSSTIDRKIGHLVTSDGAVDQTLKAEIRTLVWVRDELPNLLAMEGQEQETGMDAYGSMYDGEEGQVTTQGAEDD